MRCTQIMIFNIVEYQWSLLSHPTVSFLVVVLLLFYILPSLHTFLWDSAADDRNVTVYGAVMHKVDSILGYWPNRASYLFATCFVECWVVIFNCSKKETNVQFFLDDEENDTMIINKWLKLNYWYLQKRFMSISLVMYVLLWYTIFG